MAELEAITELPDFRGRNSARQYGRWFTLPVGQPMSLGREESQVDCAVPEDLMISRFHATLEWDGSALTVTRRDVSHGFPRPPINPIFFRSKPAEQFVMRPGEWFVIGQTRFTLRADEDSEADSPLYVTNPDWQKDGRA